jgi:hypothetical protein
LQNRKDEALSLFQAAKNICPKNTLERAFAETELKVLDSEIK